jgi:hypothetical protein
VPDITIEAAVNAQVSYRADRLGPIWTSASVGYVFLEDTTRLLLQYRKTTDGGTTWGSPVTVITDSSRMLRISVWFDKWTPGDSGTLIHCYAYNWGVDAWRYRSLDTATDTLGTEVTASPAEDDAGATNNLASMTHSTTKSRNGNLYIAYQHGTGGGWRRSTDDGATWTSRTSPFESGAIDIVAAVPANTGDDADCALIFWDTDADALSVKMYDDSADTWTETAIASSMVENADVYQLSASVRHSDGHAIVAAWSALDSATADLLIWDLTLDSIASPTVTALTNVLTDSAESGCVAVQVDQNTDDIYVAYLRGGTWGSALDAYYKVSTDGGTTWGSETILSETTDDHRGLWTDLSTAYGTAGRFAPVWKNDDLFDLVTNAGNSVELTAASGGGATVNASLLTIASTLAAPTVAVVQNATISPSLLTATTTLFAPSVSAGGTATVTPSLVSLTATVSAATVSAVQTATVSPSLLTASLSLPAATVSAAQNATITPSLQAATLTLAAPTVSTTSTATITPSALSLTATLLTATASAGGTVTVQPSILSSTLSLNAPTVTAVRAATVTPSLLSATVSLPAPSVSATSTATVTPTLLTGTLSLFAPTISAGGTVTINAPSLSLAGTVHAPTVTTIRSVTVTPSTVPLSVSLSAPSVGAGTAVTVSPSLLSLATTLFVPSVSVATGVTVSPELLTATASVLAAGITTTQSVTATPAQIAAAISILTPTINDHLNNRPGTVGLGVTLIGGVGVGASAVGGVGLGVSN